MKSTSIITLRRFRPFASAALLMLACLPSPARDKENKFEEFTQINLVSDIPGVAQITDTNLVNSWGTAFSATGPFWVSDNGTGLATLYAVTNDASGLPHVTKQGLQVTIPGEGNPTGMVFDGAGRFGGDIFLFVSEDGTISGWRPALGTAAEILKQRPGAVYKGVTLAIGASGPLLLAANFSEATVDAYDTNLTLVAQFVDTRAAAGYAPFNVQSISGTIFVTFAKQDAAKEDDVAGRGHGLIDILNPVNGSFFRFVTGKDAGGKLKEINSPWGLALAPATFGQHADQLLVGNFGDGTIMTFDASGQFQGLLNGPKNKPIVIDGLWALTFGNGGTGGVRGTLYFTSGPDDESHGLFGSLTPVEKHDNGNHGK